MLFSFINPVKSWKIIGDTTNNTIPYESEYTNPITRARDYYYFIMPAENVRIEYT